MLGIFVFVSLSCTSIKRNQTTENPEARIQLTDSILISLPVRMQVPVILFSDDNIIFVYDLISKNYSVFNRDDDSVIRSGNFVADYGLMEFNVGFGFAIILLINPETVVWAESQTLLIIDLSSGNIEEVSIDDISIEHWFFAPTRHYAHDKERGLVYFGLNSASGSLNKKNYELNLMELSLETKTTKVIRVKTRERYTPLGIDFETPFIAGINQQMVVLPVLSHRLYSLLYQRRQPRKYRLIPGFARPSPRLSFEPILTNIELGAYARQLDRFVRLISHNNSLYIIYSAGNQQSGKGFSDQDRFYLMKYSPQSRKIYFDIPLPTNVARPAGFSMIDGKVTYAVIEGSQRNFLKLYFWSVIAEKVTDPKQ
jgi:hypothetical protein